MIDRVPDITQTATLPLVVGGHGGAKSSSGFDALLRKLESGSSSSPRPEILIDGEDQGNLTPGPAPGRARSGSATSEPPSAGTTPSPVPPRTRSGSEGRTVEMPPSSIHPPGFLRSDELEGPLRFKEVPADVQWPAGPFIQAPQEYGGDWWKRSPFTGPEPWLALDRPFIKPVEVLPEGFVELFGPRPDYKDFNSYFKFQVANVGWEDTLDRFRGIGMPEGIDTEALDAATEVMLEWGLGEPQFYEDINGWHAKFPDSLNPDFEINPTTLLMAPDVTVARYQLGLIRLGAIPAELHPFIPPTVRARLSDTVVT